MFLAILMVCSLARENDCIKFTDTRGPYLSENVCIARVQEMIKIITPMLPDEPKNYRYRCDHEIGTKVQLTRTKKL